MIHESEIMDAADEIDWNLHGEVSTTCFCNCDAVYRSHSKAILVKGVAIIVSKEKCPVCGCSMGNLRKTSSDPEGMTL